MISPKSSMQRPTERGLLVGFGATKPTKCRSPSGFARKSVRKSCKDRREERPRTGPGPGGSGPRRPHARPAVRLRGRPATPTWWRPFQPGPAGTTPALEAPDCPRHNYLLVLRSPLGPGSVRLCMISPKSSMQKPTERGLLVGSGATKPRKCWSPSGFARRSVRKSCKA
jgi:hypothetical protein